jgi:glycosyltransferase involved in cell wall biosynthesis
MARYEYSLFRVANDEWVDRLRALSSLNRGRVSERPTFVSTPDLLLDAPEAHWLPLAIDVPSWSTRRPALESRVPVVLHLPSRRDPPIKGTQYIDAILRELHVKGRIEYLSPTAAPHSEMWDLVRRSDIVVDQILTGSYGVAAIEAMAAGRLVIGYLFDEVRALMPEPPPIIDATPTSFGTVMDRLLDELDDYRAIAQQGVVFAERWHGGQASADSLSTFLDVETDCGSL